ncbi:uncharacterized protein LOC108244956 isoform X2 [Kryptolebias marmoratus]|uniref:uncharacterized protein LOC108244956 isoform X2 n=1 Tax=Kryptolebias marmoratus TaxID=37003 RepID=UPI0007F923FE|nr:uncharacterized protein LOC108244956 isoform X2 [Kryptolebias marmoratus]
MKLLLFFTAAVIMTCGSADESTDSGQDLKGKMFTLSNYGGGLVFYSPDLPPPWLSTTSYSEWTTTTTKAPTTTTTRRPPTTTWTTASPTRGVSVCLRYVSSSQDVSIFTLSPSTTPMRLATNGLDSYYLSFNDYNSVSLRTDVPWTNINLNIWTSICLTVDTVKSVVQVFNGPMMSYRKLMTYRYSWSGEPVIDFTGFEGQLTDVQSVPRNRAELVQHQVLHQRQNRDGGQLRAADEAAGPQPEARRSSEVEEGSQHEEEQKNRENDDVMKVGRARESTRIRILNTLICGGICRLITCFLKTFCLNKS